jgi:hypothetical protein
MLYWTIERPAMKRGSCSASEVMIDTRSFITCELIVREIMMSLPSTMPRMRW